MTSDGKKRHVISYDNIKGDLAVAFAEKYPRGFNDYFPDLVKYTKPDGTPFYAVTVETSDAIYLVKLKVNVDDAEDLQNWLDGEAEAEAEQMAGASGPSDSDDTSLPDDNISQYGGVDSEPDSDD